MLHKDCRPYFENITPQACSIHRTDNHSPIWWTELGSQVVKCSEGPGPRPLPAFTRIFLALDKDPYFILNTLEPQEKLPRPRPQTVIDSAKFVSGCDKELCHSPYMRASWKVLLKESSPPFKNLSVCLSVCLSLCLARLRTLCLWVNF